MKVLLVYATNSNGTQQVAEIIAAELQEKKHQVMVKRAYEPGAEQFADYDLVLLGSCTWERFEGKKRLEGELQQHMYELVQHMQTASFPKKKFALFGLGDSSYTDFCAAVDHLEKFVDHLGGTQVTKPLRIEGFFFDLDANRQRAAEWGKNLAAQL